jgi:hypothetical protein
MESFMVPGFFYLRLLFSGDKMLHINRLFMACDLNVPGRLIFIFPWADPLKQS